jgi:hypothetical protein
MRWTTAAFAGLMRRSTWDRPPFAPVTTLVTRLRKLDADQLGIVELVLAAIARGAV